MTTTRNPAWAVLRARLETAASHRSALSVLLTSVQSHWFAALPPAGPARQFQDTPCVAMF
jgi:hypothetical protein